MSRALRHFWLALCVMLAPAGAHALTAGASLCATVKVTEVTALIGETPGTPISTGPEADDDHANAIATSCRYEGKARVFALMLLDFTTVDGAVAALKHDVDAVKASGDAKMTPVQSSGLGDDVYLATDQSSATYVARKGARLIAIGVAGETSAVADLPAALLKVAQSAAAHLPPAATKPRPSVN